MPRYEFKCTECDHLFEVQQKFSDEPIQECPECSGSVEKQISRNTFKLKGSGWYATDYTTKSSGEMEA